MGSGVFSFMEQLGKLMHELTDKFANRHIGPTHDEVNIMLSALKLRSLDELTDTTLPDKIKCKKPLNLPQALEEAEMLGQLQNLAKQNKLYRSYLGYGFHDCITPQAIKRHILENPGWYTQYTPYQPEISQGRLESLLNFQTMIADLTGLPVANASLLDEPTASAEAMALSHNIKNKDGSKVFFIDQRAHPATIEVVCGRAKAINLGVIIGDFFTFDFDTAICGALLAYPTTCGLVKDLTAFIKKVQDNGGLAIVSCDLLMLTMLKSPGELGADVAVGSAQRFGVPLGYGGPHAAFFATKEDYKRFVPGRIVGVSRDKNGKPALRLALQTREQHIRRERATSNICTAQALLANMASMYAVYHGPNGLKRIAQSIHLRTLGLAAGMRQLGHKIVHDCFFDTILIELANSNAKNVLEYGQTQKVNIRIVNEKRIIVALDETVSDSDCQQLLDIVNCGQPSNLSFVKILALIQENIPPDLVRTSSFLKHPVFNSYHSETNLMRYIKSLEAKDLSLTTSMIPLGSCTMKLNAACELAPVSWPEWASMHPFAPREQAQGYQNLFDELEKMLAEITGFDAISLQPNSGAQGEYAGLCVIKAYLEKKGAVHRNICLIPASAHGTNPASAVMAGFKVVVVNCDDQGNIDLKDLQIKVDKYRSDLAALMLTYPSTHGVFEESVVEICQMIHDAGGQVYMDGANLNAQVGLCRPGDFGPDVCHINLHKTFCIPHGGGGPGMGPIGVKQHLKEFLPGARWFGVGGKNAGQAVSGAPWGSAGILPISWAYCRLMGSEGLKKATQVAILNANYIAHRLDPYFKVLYRGRNKRVAHECIIDLRPLKASVGIEVADVAKRLMDYGFHAPTMSFPVAGTLMIEPTESEDKKELDRFCDAMISIYQEIENIESGQWDKQNNPLKNAPHTIFDITSNAWDFPYSREVAVLPKEWLYQRKFWPSVGRIDDAYGDRNLVCTCPDMENYK